MYRLNDNEKNFIEILNEAMRYIKGELELNNVEGDWYVLDYREDLGSAFNIDVAPYDKPLITEEEAEEKGIDVRKCCDYVGAYIVG